MVKFFRNVSNNCYFSLIILDLEKRVVDIKVYLWWENFVFNFIELYSGIL